MNESLWWPSLATATLAFLLVGLVRRLAVRHGVLDHPSDRSSHLVVTPRGGGLGLLLAALGPWGWRALQSASVLVGSMLLGAVMVALIGWIDDRRGLGVRTRLAVHVFAALLLGMAASNGIRPAMLAIIVFSWWTFWTVSSINLVNFMDGINGLVALQIAVFAGSLALFPGPADGVRFYAVILAAACIGFLPWNFPRARIFLGDVGSGALGFVVPALALLAYRTQGVDFMRANLPLLPLYGDATVTIIRRWRNRERLTSAHRTHLYQQLANGGMGHTKVTLTYTAAAICGVLIAHLVQAASILAWTLAYVILNILLGVQLHRRVRRSAPATT